MNKYNAAVLKQFSIVYISEDEIIENKLEMIKILFKNVVSLRDFSEVKKFDREFFIQFDMVLVETNQILEYEEDLFKSIRNICKKIPIVLLTNSIDKKVLDVSLDYYITGHLLRPLKMQELSKQAFVRIQRYHRKENMKNSLKYFSNQYEPLKNGVKKLTEQLEYKTSKIEFYEKLHNEFLNSIKIDKLGMIQSISNSLISKFDEKIIGTNINRIFKTPAKIQKALLISLKERKTVSEVDVILFLDGQKEEKINVMPYFEKEGSYFFYIFI